MAQQQKDSQGKLWFLGSVFLLALFSLAMSQIYGWMSQDAMSSEVTRGDGYQRTADILYGVCLVMTLAGVGIGLVYLISYIQNLRDQNEAIVENTRRMLTGQTQTEAVLTNINENLLLSDAIKSIAFRQKDRSVLELAIREDLRLEHWDSASWLIGELEKRFGGKQEAQGLREEMARAQSSTIQEKFDAAIKNLDSLWMIHHYKEAQQLEDSLIKRFVNSEKVKALKGATERRRQSHKKELLVQLDKANQENDLDRGVEILKLLDNYLTPTEAAALKESARDVFRARLHNMGVQFSLYVTEKTWDKALKIGKQIIEEYPNSRMAQEVREKIHALESRVQ